MCGSHYVSAGQHWFPWLRWGKGAPGLIWDTGELDPSFGIENDEIARNKSNKICSNL